MPSKLTYRGEVDTDGRASQTLRERVSNALRLYAGRDVQITIEPPRRSTTANAYYFGVVVPEVQRVMVNAGILAPTEAVHDWLKRRHIPGLRVVEVMGESITLPASSAILNSTDFHDYLMRIRTDETLLAMGCNIRDPEVPITGHVIREAA